MILAKSYTAEWIHSHRAKEGQEKIDPTLTKKMIHALGLVELLGASELEFVFKGGTSLILLLNNPGRFSIDIDIVTSANKAQIEKVLEGICNGTPFIKFILNENRSYKPGVPKAHYSLVYISSLTKKEEHILLDILFEESLYPKLLEVEIKSDWLYTDEKKILIKIPTHESITGDKLTAFAPNTTGIPYRAEKELEIIKQLYDLGNLFHKIKDITVVAAAFQNIVAKEIKYRGDKWKPEEVLQDIIDTSLLIAKRGKIKNEPMISNFKEIEKGLLQFKSYQINSFFRMDDAIVASSKAAYMAAAIKVNMKEPLKFFSNEIKKENLLVQNKDFEFLNKLPPEPLYYWNNTLVLLGYK